MARIDITNQRFGKLTAIAPAGHSKHGDVLWLCKCDCGNQKQATTASLRKGNVKSCGCLNQRPSIAGQRFGRLTAIENHKNDKNETRWRCLCDCGKEVSVYKNNLKSGKTRSCGCIRVERLEGQRFNKLTVLAEAGRGKHGEVLWKCLCDCGKETIVGAKELRKSEIKSCGCIRVMRIEGQRFGRLTVIEEAGRKDGKVLWRCLCDCGNETTVTSRNLRFGCVRSCGCISLERTKEMVSELLSENCFEGTNLLKLNEKPGKTNTSGFRGVSFSKQTKKWRATIVLSKKHYWLGSYDTLEAAAEARREAEIELYDPILKKYGRNPTSEEDYQERLKAAIERQREKH